MKDQKKILYFEIILTLTLVLMPVFLLREILSYYSLAVPAVLIAGIFVSWLTRKTQALFGKIFLNAGAILTLVWIIYSILHSSLEYKEVILIFIKSILVLECIFSFCLFSQGSLSLMQNLSLALFMSHPLFLAGFDKVVSLVYFALWLIVIKLKLYLLVSGEFNKESKVKYSFFVGMAFFALAAFIAWFALSNLSVGKIKKGGFLSEEDKEMGKLESSPKEYYDMQDQIQSKVLNLIPQLDRTEQRYEIVTLLNKLIKDSPDVMEVDKAQTGLISMLRNPGSGVNKNDADKLITLIKKYSREKANINLRMAKDQAVNALQKKPFDLAKKVSFLSRINKISGANSTEELNKSGAELNKMIEDSSLNNSDKRELKDSINKLKDWKMLELYRKKMDMVQKRIDELKDPGLKKELSDLLKDTEEMEEPAQSENIKNKIERLKKDELTANEKDILDRLKELADLKADMIMESNSKETKNELKDLESLAQYSPEEFNKAVDDIKNAQDAKDLSKAFSDFKEKFGDNKEALDKISELVKEKSEMLLKDNLDSLNSQLENNLNSEVSKEISDKLQDLELYKDQGKVNKDAEKIEERLQQLSQQGIISKQTKDALKTDVGEVRDLLLVKLEAEGVSEGRDTQKPESGDSQNKFRESVDSSSLKDTNKDIFRKMQQEAGKADNITKLNNLEEVSDKESQRMVGEGEKKEEVQDLKNEFKDLCEIKKMFVIDKAISQIMDNLEQLKMNNPDVASEVEERLEEIREAKNNEELEKQVKELEEYINSQESQIKENDKNDSGNDESDFVIRIFPSRVVIPVGAMAYLRASAVFKDMFLKDVSSELEWYTSDGTVAVVDGRGVVHAISKGNVKVFAKYKGVKSSEVEITVTDLIPAELLENIKSRV
ncbi:hypothetical protein EPO66_04590 [bacterium]|nr:MAG: hypothetical protein EPO66_04590 [bacterium]